MSLLMFVSSHHGVRPAVRLADPFTPDHVRAMSRTMKALLGLWIAVLVGAASWIGWDTWHGGQPAIGGAFTLVDQNGQSFSSDRLKGKPTLIYFGYTFCPDVCPTSLLLMETAVEQLGPDAAKKVNLVFITVDPERDTPALIKGYVENFGPTIIGLTGTPAQIEAATRAYRVYFQKVPSKNGGPYLMDHSSILYLLDRNERFITHFTHETKAEAIKAALSRML
jgi:protein SCO1/2